MERKVDIDIGKSPAEERRSPAHTLIKRPLSQRETLSKRKRHSHKETLSQRRMHTHKETTKPERDPKQETETLP
jgi:hypothetical protein